MGFPENEFQAAAWEYAKRNTPPDASVYDLYQNYEKAFKELLEQLKSNRKK